MDAESEGLRILVKKSEARWDNLSVPDALDECEKTRLKYRDARKNLAEVRRNIQLSAYDSHLLLEARGGFEFYKDLFEVRGIKIRRDTHPLIPILKLLGVGGERASRWHLGLRYALQRKIEPTNLLRFLADSGGIEKCADLLETPERKARASKIKHSSGHAGGILKSGRVKVTTLPDLRSKLATRHKDPRSVESYSGPIKGLKRTIRALRKENYRLRLALACAQMDLRMR